MVVIGSWPAPATAVARYDARTHRNTEFDIVKGGFDGAVRVVCTSHGPFCARTGATQRGGRRLGQRLTELEVRRCTVSV
jgi:hypothetical protein